MTFKNVCFFGDSPIGHIDLSIKKASKEVTISNIQEIIHPSQYLDIFRMVQKLSEKVKKVKNYNIKLGLF